MKRFFVILTFALTFALTIAAQDSGETEQAPSLQGTEQVPSRQRMSRIGMFRIGLGCGVSGWSNLVVAPEITFGVGSYRNVLNGELGVRYTPTIPLAKDAESVTNHHLTVWLSMTANYYRWQRNCLYAGAEIAGNFNVGALPYSSHFASVAALVGVRVSALDIALRYEYDINPRYNQKYVYETEGYDFDALRGTVYERMRVGVTVRYYFTLGL